MRTALVVALLAMGACASPTASPDTVGATLPPPTSTTMPAPTSTTATTSTPTTTTTTEPADDPGTESIGVTDKVTITIVDEP